MPQVGRLRQALLDGRTAYGMGHFSGAVELVEIAGYTGFDFVYLDMHIAPLTLETVRNLIPAAYMSGITPLVRVTSHDWSEINRALNLGCEGLVVPHVDTKEEAQSIIEAARYLPAGTRGACPNVRASHYNSIEWVEYSQTSNRDTWIIPIVESRVGVENFADIISTPGIEIVILGAHDLSVSLGVPGKDFRDPTMRVAFDSMLAAAKERGVKTWTTTVLSMDSEYVSFLEESGIDMVSFNTDLGIFHRACLRLLREKSL